MEKKVVKFTETMYGLDLCLTIVNDGRTIAERLNAPPDGKTLLYGQLKKSLIEDRGNYNVLSPLAPELEKDIDSGHSGASFSAVLWAAGTFLLGHDILVNDTQLVTGL